MRRLNFDFIPGPVRRWSPPVIGIPLMLVWAAWGGEAVRFVLFTHHLFWAASIGLLIGPLIETFAARPTKGKVKLSRRKIPAEARRAKTRPSRAQPAQAPPAAQTVDERLALLRKQQAAIDRNIARLTRDTEHDRAIQKSLDR